MKQKFLLNKNPETLHWLASKADKNLSQQIYEKALQNNLLNEELLTQLLLNGLNFTQTEYLLLMAGYGPMVGAAIAQTKQIPVNSVLYKKLVEQNYTICNIASKQYRQIKTRRTQQNIVNKNVEQIAK